MTSRMFVLAAALAASVPVAAQEGRLAPLRMRAAAPAAGDQKVALPRSGVRVPLEAKIVTGAPYSAEVVIETVQTLGDGNRIVSRTTGRVYRDAQGRTRREEDAQPGRVATVAINDPVGGVAFSLDPESRVAWKTTATASRTIVDNIQPSVVPFDDAELQRKIAEILDETGKAPTRAPAAAAGGRLLRSPAAGTENVEKLSARLMEGVMAEGVRITRTIPAGAIGNEQPIVSVTEEWVSPELQTLVMTRTSDPRSGEHTYRLLNIVRADVSGSWFQVPADYTVRETGVNRLVPTVRR